MRHFCQNDGGMEGAHLFSFLYYKGAIEQEYPPLDYMESLLPIKQIHIHCLYYSFIHCKYIITN